MNSRGPKAVAIGLSVGEREQLESWARRRGTASGLAMRARIVLAAAEGQSNVAIAKRLGVSVPTARRWRQRFSERRLDGLVDEPRPGQPRKITDQKVEEVIVKTLEERPPDGGTHWSTRQMAALGRAQSDGDLQDLAGVRAAAPPGGALEALQGLIVRGRSVTSSGLYLDPPERALVFCVDEKSQIQALDRSAPTMPMLPGTPRARDA